jgi:hypothetical protein
MLFCAPICKQKLKIEKHCNVTVKTWDVDTALKLQCYFECTDWSMLYDVDACIDENVEVITSHINFCVSMIVPSKCITIYANNKPWVTKEVKLLLNDKKRALSFHDRAKLKDVQKALSEHIAEAKKNYRLKVEDMFKSNNSKEAWKGLKMLCDYQTKTSNADPTDINNYVNELNKFYNRFDGRDFSKECEEILNVVKGTNDSRIVVTREDVTRSINRMKIGKSSGPD